MRHKRIKLGAVLVRFRLSAIFQWSRVWWCWASTSTPHRILPNVYSLLLVSIVLCTTLDTGVCDEMSRWASVHTSTSNSTTNVAPSHPQQVPHHNNSRPSDPSTNLLSLLFLSPFSLKPRKVTDLNSPKSLNKTITATNTTKQSNSLHQESNFVPNSATLPHKSSNYTFNQNDSFIATNANDATQEWSGEQHQSPSNKSLNEFDRLFRNGRETHNAFIKRILSAVSNEQHQHKRHGQGKASNQRVSVTSKDNNDLGLPEEIANEYIDGVNPPKFHGVRMYSIMEGSDRRKIKSNRKKPDANNGYMRRNLNRQTNPVQHGTPITTTTNSENTDSHVYSHPIGPIDKTEDKSDISHSEQNNENNSPNMEHGKHLATTWTIYSLLSC